MSAIESYDCLWVKENQTTIVAPNLDGFQQDVEEIFHDLMRKSTSREGVKEEYGLTERQLEKVESFHHQNEYDC